MKQGLWDLWKWRVTNWLEEPLGEVPVLTEPEVALKDPSRPAKNYQVGMRPDRKNGYQKETASNIPEFHPRGSAGHREIYSPKATHKGVLPYAGKGVKHPKNEVVSNVQESHPGGSAGHREIYVQKSHHKAGMPYAGKGVKHSK
jgi:hypothetical protein